jgi:hypothetical protein
MALSPKLAGKKEAVVILLLVSLMAPCLIKIRLGKAGHQTLVFPGEYPTITAAIGNATEADVDSVAVKQPEWVSPSPSPSPSPTPTPIDTEPVPTTLLVAVAIIACVFGFGLIVNLLTGKRKSSNHTSSREASRVRRA